MTVHPLELAPRRNDGYDLSDWLKAHPEIELTIPRLRELAPAPTQRVASCPQLALSDADPATPRLASRGSPTLGLGRWVP